MIDEKAIQAALDAAFEVAEQLETILLAARRENRRAAAQERIEAVGVPQPDEIETPGEGTPVASEGGKLSRKKPEPPPDQEWLMDVAKELQISDSQFYYWHREGHFEMYRHGGRNALRKSDAWRLREIVGKKPRRFQTNARWVSAWFRGQRD